MAAKRALRPEHLTLEVPADGFAKQCCFVRTPRLPLQADQQRKPRGARKVLGPADDEFLGSWIEIALMKRRWIDGAEELSQLGHPDADDLRPGWDLVASRR